MGFIKNIFSGILSFFIGLFGGKKSQQNKPSLEADKSATPAKNKRKRNGYFMELEEADETSSTNGKQQALASVAKAAESVADKATKAAESVADKVTKTAESVADKATKTAAPVAAKATKAAESVADKATDSDTKTAEPVVAKSTKAETKTAEPVAATQQPKVQLEQTAEGVKPVPVKPAASTLNKPQAETTFAPKYLNPSSSSNGRRRPGPNMSSFLDMARQVKSPG